MICYACKTPGAEPYRIVDGYRLLICRSCRLIWCSVDQQIAAKAVQLYDTGYFSSQSVMGYRDYIGDEEIHRRNAQSLLSRTLTYIAAGKPNIVDFGCAYGFFSDEAAKAGCVSAGIEISHEAVLHARKLGVRAGSGFNELNIAENSLDAVYMVGTIEHLADPRSELEGIHARLKQDGILVITTLDTLSPARLYSLKPPEHLYYFNKRNLAILLKDCGFETLGQHQNKTWFRVGDLLHRLTAFAGLPAVGRAVCKAINKIGDVAIQIPTNEMVVIARRLGAQSHEVVPGRAD